MEYEYWYANVPGISNRKKQGILQYVHTPKEIYNMKQCSMTKIPNLLESEAMEIRKSAEQWDVKREYEQLQLKKIKFLTIQQPEYPKKLKNIYNPPYGLYIKGSIPDETRKRVAIVGARRCSHYGEYVAKQFGKLLARYQVDVISGMATGVDSFGHWGCVLGGGRTYAVLGNGIEICYPPRNQELFKKIQETGGLISEFPIKKQPAKHMFPLRNRLISGLCDAVVVVEAREKSGSLITADFALEQGRDVYAVPGRITDALSEGTNRLILQGAAILNTFEELLLNLNINATIQQRNNNFERFTLEKSEKLVYSCVDLSPKNIDILMEETKLELLKLMEILTTLQAKGYIKEVFKNYYVVK